jgi:hypothetical protein
MRSLIFTIACFFGCISSAGPRVVGNGGDPLALEFKTRLFTAIEALRHEPLVQFEDVSRSKSDYRR